MSILVLQNIDFIEVDGRLTYNERMEEELVDYYLDPLDEMGNNTIFYSQGDFARFQKSPRRWLIFWPIILWCRGCETLVLLVVWKILVWRMGLEEKPNFETLEVGIMGWGSIVDQNHSLYHDGENNNVVLSRLLLAQNLRGNSFLQGYIIDDSRSCQAMYKELISKKIGAHDIL